jgi:hypothetical protein
MWYLLDHSDGELARWKETSSASGLYFDTIVNAIVPPLSLAAMGFGLRADGGAHGFPYVGLAAGYGSLMLLMIPFCEAAVLLQVSKGTAIPQPAPKASAPPSFSAGSLFGMIHTAVSFPAFLLVVTIPAVGALMLHTPAMNRTLGFILPIYAVTITFVWVAVLFKTVLTKRVDRRMAGLL